MKTTIILPLLLLLPILGTTYAATHVNITIGDHPADVTYINGKAPDELKAGPSRIKTTNLDCDDNVDNVGGSAKLIYGQQSSNYEYNDNLDKPHNFVGNLRNSGFQYDGRSARIQIESDQQQSSQQQQQQQQQTQNDQSVSGVSNFDNRNDQVYSNAQVNEQDKQNQEFERYIQNYHTGPTVETVYEAASPSSKGNLRTSANLQSAPSSVSSSSSSSSSQRVVTIGSTKPAQVHTFERVVALSSNAPHTVVSSSSSTSAIDANEHQAIVKQIPNVNNDVSRQSESSTNFDRSGFYSKSNYNQGNYNINSKDSVQQQDLYNQYPSSLDGTHTTTHGGYSNNEQSSNFYPQSGSSSSTAVSSGVSGAGSGNSGYLPPQQQVYQRPVVTKTIQIAQPALRAKKYEIRHPALQKEFYDIEERVVIKPAGTVVVELERPVAKIPKGETILPLGHPHPAVAGAYSQNSQRVYQTQSSSAGQYGSTGGGNAAPVSHNKEYSPNPVYNGDHALRSSTTVGSTVTSSPSYNQQQQSRNDFVESKLTKQFKDEPQFVSATERNYIKDQNSADFVYPSHVETSNNGVSVASSRNDYNNFNYGEQRASVVRQNQGEFESKLNDDNRYKAEPLSEEFFKGVQNQNGPKPARLEQAQQPDQQTRLVTHEHKIVLPPTQHNIYLGRAREPAQLRGVSSYTNGDVGIKSFLQQNRDAGGVVYVMNSKQPVTTISQQQQQQRNYVQSEGRNGIRRVQYNTPYANMRYVSAQQAQGSQGFSGLDDNRSDKNFNYNVHFYNKGNLVAERDQQSRLVEAGDATNTQSEVKPHAHIQIKIPNQYSQEASKAIVVSSTISPPVSQQQTAKYRQNRYHTNFYNNRGDGGDQQFNTDRFAKLETKTDDCNEQDAEVVTSARYESPQQQRNGHFRTTQKFMRLADASTSNAQDSNNNKGDVSQIQPNSVDVNLKSTSGHVTTVGQRVIAATPAPTDSAASSESLHKRRIVVNHPFQTVREVVEHEPITNYHQIQVNEPAMPALYTASESANIQVGLSDAGSGYYHNSAVSNGHLHYLV